MNSDEKRNITYYGNKDTLNNSNYIKSKSVNKRLLEYSLREDSRNMKNDSLVSNSFLMKRKNK